MFQDQENEQHSWRVRVGEAEGGQDRGGGAGPEGTPGPDPLSLADHERAVFYPTVSVRRSLGREGAGG